MPDPLVEDVVGWPAVAPHLMRALLFLVTPTLLLIVWVGLSYLESISTPDPVNRLIVGGAGWLVVVLYVSGAAAFFVPTKEPIAEYARLAPGAAAHVDDVVERVRATAAARELPARVSASTIAGVPVLLFRQRSERVMLLVQPYGQDLYLGWTMWRARSAATLFGHFLRDTYGRALPWPWFSAELRAAATRALRESVHALANDALDGLAAAGPPARPDPPDTRAGWPATGAQPVYRPGPGTGALPRPAPPVDPTSGRWPRPGQPTTRW